MRQTRASSNEKPRRFGRTGALDGEIAGSWGAKRSRSVRLNNVTCERRFPVRLQLNRIVEIDSAPR